MSDLKRTLACAIVNFLKTQLNSGDVNESSKEGLELGIQCLESAYEIGDDSGMKCAYDLEEIFCKYLKKQEDENFADLNENKTVAEILKNEGNSYMNNCNFKEAISSYTRAIELDPQNAVYYCNRAAALNSFGNYDTAIEDCKTALKYNPLYHKAYARMGVAYKAKSQLKEARDNFKKALELQPENENYKMQMNDIESSLRNSPNHMINIEINGARFPLENDIANIINMARSVFNNENSL